MAQSGNALAYDSTSSGGREQTKIAIRDEWMVNRCDSAIVDLETSGTIRLKFRSLLPPGTEEPGKYVVQIIVDGEPEMLC